MTDAEGSGPRGERRPDELLLDELTEQLDRTRRLLTGSPGDAGERALTRIGGETEMDARLASDLAVAEPLAEPERFPEAHRLVMRALEILDRDGYRSPSIGGFGPIKPLGRAAVEFVARYIVRSHTRSIVEELAALYAQRESQCERDAPERRLLARARVEVERLTPKYGGGGIGAVVLLAIGAGVPALASLAQPAGAIDLDRRLLLPGVLVPLALFGLVAWLLLRGAAVARRRSQLLMRQPLAALWETIGHAGDPPEDGSVGIATIAIVLTALVWFALPAVVAIGLWAF